MRGIRAAARAAVLVAIIATVIGASAQLAAARGTSRKSEQVTGAFHIETNVVWRIVDGEALTLDAYVPDGNGHNRAAVLLVHGGAWKSGDKSDFAEEGRQLAAAGFVAVSVNYRLIPAHPFPAAIDDIQAAVRWLRDSAQVHTYGIDPHRIGAMGGSAGGHLVAMAGMLGTGPIDTGSRVAVVVSWSGLNDLAAVPFQGFGTDLFGCSSQACPQVAASYSPISYVDPTDPPMLLVNAAHDPITHIDQVTRMDAQLTAAGVDHQVMIVPGSGHYTQLAPAAWATSLTFLEQHLAQATR